MPRDRLQRILALAIPIIGAMISQNIFNLVDTAMVGRVGPAALAAVGLASFVNFVSVAAITGLSMGVQAMAARRKGAGELAVMAVPLNGGLLIAAAIGIPLSILIIALTPWFFPYLHDDPAVVAAGVPYLEARLLAMVAVGMNFAFRGYWNGVNQSGLYLRTLLIMHACNIALNYVLIFGHLGFPALGAEGAGIGTAIATFIGTAIYMILGFRHARESGFLQSGAAAGVLRRLVTLSAPAMAQNVFFALGFLIQFKIVGLVGTQALAAATILVNVALVAVLPGMAMGLAAASLVGQALGRSDTDDADRWAWDVIRVAAVILGLIGLPMALAPTLILAVFTDDAATIALAEMPLRIVGVTTLIDAFGMVLLNALGGAGATRAAMTISIATQWGLFLPAAYIAGPYLGYGLTGIWVCFFLYRVIQAIILVRFWRRRSWAGLEV